LCSIKLTNDSKYFSYMHYVQLNIIWLGLKYACCFNTEQVNLYSLCAVIYNITLLITIYK